MRGTADFNERGKSVGPLGGRVIAKKTHTADSRIPVAAICRGCRFGRGEDRACVLLQEGDEQRLLDEGPCRLHQWIPSEVKGLLRRRYPFARRIEDDIASDVLLAILGTSLRGTGKIRHFIVLQRRLRELIRSRVIDALRHHGLVTRIRCGSCIHHANEDSPECTLPWLQGVGEENRANPWYGARIATDEDPRRLKPPCEAFEWKRPETHDIFEEEVPGMDEEGSPRERAASLLVQAIDRISRQDEQGMKIASVLFWHYLRGKEVKLLAEEGGVSEKTIKRLLHSGRERLLEVLRDEMGIDDPGEVL